MLVVLGMHRSGTSMVTRMLYESGFSMGPRHDINDSPHPNNPTGLYEPGAIMRLNRELMEQWGAEWDAPRVAQRNQLLRLVKRVHKRRRSCGREERDRALRYDTTVAGMRAYIKTAFPEGVGVVKDPRLCITWPTWWPILNPKIVVVLRNPLEVTASLKARAPSGTFAQDIALWEDHARGILEAVKGREFVVVRYELLLAGLDELQRLVDFVGRPVPSTCMNADHRRQRAEDPLAEGSRLDTEQKAVWRELLELRE
jgi:hypothetical protein